MLSEATGNDQLIKPDALGTFGRMIGKGDRRRPAAMALTVVAWAVFVLIGQIDASASTLPAPPAVLSAGAAPGELPAPGGTITVAGRVEHATSCRLQILSSQSFAVVYSHNAKSCASGSYSAHISVGPNPTAVPRTIAFALVASNGTSSSTDRFYVLLASPAPPAVLSTSAAPGELPAAGGTITVAGRVEHATQCQLQLLSIQSFSVFYSHNAKSCASGSYSAHISVGPNPTAVPRTIAFALVASNGASAFTERFYVLLASAAAKAATNPSLPTSTKAPATPTIPSTTTVPGTTPSLPVASEQSSNWSGYAAVGGPYTVVKGSFTVPSPAEGTPGGDQVSEWVGVDGMSASDSSLIQAGVEEYPDPYDPAGFVVQPWWEILPAAETNITTMTVNAGDDVTVTIWQVSGTTWEIRLVDDTTGQGFTTPPEQYTGPGSTADWVVEATTECQFQCQTSQLAPYSPPVSFSDLGMSGAPKSLNEVTMVQGQGVVSTPSALSPDGFTVSYTGNQYFADKEQAGS
jgi:hypothetical protein